MKNRLLMLMLAAFVAFSAGAVFAQQESDQDQAPQGQQGPPPQGGGEQGGGRWGHGGHGGRGGRMDPSKRAQMLTEQLNLTKDQQSKVKDILSAQQKQMESAMQDQSGSREDKRAKFEQMRSETDSQIRAILNGDQQQKFDTMLKDREQHMRGGRQGEGRYRKQGGEGNNEPSNNNGPPSSNP